MGWKPSLDGLFRRAFFRWGLLVYRFRWLVLGLSSLAALACLPGIPLFLEANTINDYNYIFVPQGDDLRHRRERLEFVSRWPHQDDAFAAESSFNDVHIVYVYLSARQPGANLLQPHLMDEVTRIERMISTLRVETGRQMEYINRSETWGFPDFCAGNKGDCYDNSEFVDLLRFLGPEDPFTTSNTTLDRKRHHFFEHNFKLRWPRAWKDRNQLSLSNIVSAPRTVTEVDISDCYRGGFDYGAFVDLVGKLRALNGSHFFDWDADLILAANRVVIADSEKAQIAAMRDFEAAVRESDVLGKVDYVNNVLLVYYVAKEGEKGRVAEVWREAVTAELLGLNSTLVKASLYATYRTLDDAVAALQAAVTPKFAVAFLSMAVFACLSTLALHRPRGEGSRRAVDWRRSKPVLAVSGVVGAGLAIGSAMGLLAYCGVAFNAVVCVMPILVISIGVDDMFVMVGAWERTSPASPTPVRMAQMMEGAAVAISITSLTDFLGFFVGCFARIPVVQLFCLYTALAIALDFAFQVTFFAAVMAILGDVEEDNRHSLTLRPIRSDEDSGSCLQRHLGSGSTVSHPWKSREERDKVAEAEVKALRESPGAEGQQSSTDGLIPRFFRERYGPWLMGRWMGLAAAVLQGAYLFGAVWGCAVMGEGMEMRRVFYSSSPEGTLDRLGRDFMLELANGSWKGGQTFQVLATQLPDLSDRLNRQRLNQSLGRFLGQDTTMGEDGVNFWLWDYERWYVERTGRRWFNGSRAFRFYYRLRDYYLEDGPSVYPLTKVMAFESDERQDWCERNQSAVWEDLCPFYRLSALRVLVSMRDTTNTHLQAVNLRAMRRVAEAEAEWGWVVYSPFNGVLDGVISLMPLTIRNLVIASVAMFVVALLLVPSLRGTVLVTLSVVSIDVGVFGFLALWGCNIDSISTIAILMAVGFGVDLSAHVTHGFLSAAGSGEERAVRALETYGAAVLQGGLSTLLCLPALLLEVDHYIVQVFVKGIFLVITFGLLHSLVFLPQLLAIFVPSEETSSCSLPLRRKDKVARVHTGQVKLQPCDLVQSKQ